MRQSWEVNKVQTGWALVQVLESRIPNISVGSFYATTTLWQEEVVTNLPEPFIPVPNGAPENLAIAGIAGLTAVLGIEVIGKVKQGDTVVVSAAAGSVGVLVGQIAKIYGAHVIGTCGSDEKCQLLTSQYGFDHVINYKTTKDIKSAIKAACPKGTVDLYFDNVGGTVSDAVMDLIGNFARIVVCGQISVYNEDDPNSAALQGPRNWFKLIYTGARIEGFTIGQHTQLWPSLATKLLQWHSEGKLRTPISVEHGLENFGKAFVNLFDGENKGKQLVKV